MINKDKIDQDDYIIFEKIKKKTDSEEQMEQDCREANAQILKIR